MVVWGLWNKPDPQTLRPSCHYNMFANTKIEFAFRVEQPLGDSALHEVGIWMNGSILTACALVVYCCALLHSQLPATPRIPAKFTEHVTMVHFGLGQRLQCHERHAVKNENIYVLSSQTGVEMPF